MGSSDGNRTVLFIIIGIIVVLIIFFLAWWMLTPRTIVIPEEVEKQILELQKLIYEDEELLRQYTTEVVLHSPGAEFTRGVVDVKLKKTVSIVYYKDHSTEAVLLTNEKVDLLVQYINGGDREAIVKRVTEINHRLAKLFAERLPKNLREEKSKQFFKILMDLDGAILTMSIAYQDGKYAESYAAYNKTKEYFREYFKMASWALVACYSYDPTVA